MKKTISVSWLFALLLICSAPYVSHAQNSPAVDQQSALGKCYGESKSAWLVGLGIEGKQSADQTADFISSLPHSSETKRQISENAIAMAQGRFAAAEDLGAAQYTSCVQAHSLQSVNPEKIADCLYYLRIMNSFDASRKRGEAKDRALEATINASPGATDGTKRLLKFLADRTYATSDINLEHRMTFDWCAGKR